MNLAMLLEMAASGFDTRVAVGSRHGGITYSELLRRSRVCAGRISAGGFSEVLYVGPASLAFPIALFGSALAGRALVPISYRLAREQLQRILDNHPGSLLVAATPDLLPDNPAQNMVVSVQEFTAWSEVGTGVGSMPAADPEAIAIVLYTSGTTAAPKAALLRHRHLASYVVGTVQFGAAEEAEAALVSVPPYHVAGVANLLSNVYAGRRIVYLENFAPQDWLAAVRRETVTSAMVVPTMLARIVEHLGHADSADTPSLHTLAYGGARLPMPVLQRALELFPSTGFVNAYGLTETSSTIAVLNPEDHRIAAESDDPAVRRRLTSVGRIVPGVEVEVHEEDGKPVSRGQPGEIWVRGEQVSGEYGDGRSPVDQNGWFPTRDRGWIDQDGYLFLEGRIDDIIIRGGENIAPAEIEEVLLRHPDVLEAAVVGPGDVEWGQRIAAVVVRRAGKELSPTALQTWVREALRGSKTPDQIVFVDRLPRTENGKIIRRQVLSLLESSAR